MYRTDKEISERAVNLQSHISYLKGRLACEENCIQKMKLREQILKYEAARKTLFWLGGGTDEI